MQLSIIIPAYNVGKFIKKTLTMLISQKLKNCEVIVIDDGSKDDTLVQAQIVAKEHSEIKIFHQDNKGVSIARNEGLKIASGQYIYFMDSDDTLTEGTLDYYRQMIEKHSDCQMFLVGYETHVNGKIAKKYLYPKFEDQVLDKTILQQSFFAKKLCCHICSTIYDSNFLKKNNLKFFEGQAIGEDVDFILNCIALLERAYYSVRTCFVYQIRNDSAMQGYKKYNKAIFHSLETRTELTLKVFNSNEIKNYANFWVENQILSNIVLYLKSDCSDSDITQALCTYCSLFKLPISGVKGALKNKTAISIAKILPMKTIIRSRKSK